MACPSTKNVIDDMESAITMKYPSHVYMPCRNIIFKNFYCIAKKVPHEIYEIVTLFVIKILGFPSPK